jgi:hypothetical protein
MGVGDRRRIVAKYLKLVGGYIEVSIFADFALAKDRSYAKER